MVTDHICPRCGTTPDPDIEIGGRVAGGPRCRPVSAADTGDDVDPGQFSVFRTAVSSVPVVMAVAPLYTVRIFPVASMR
jgi:hypothetical protein